MKSKPSDRRIKEYVYSLPKPVARSRAFMAAAVSISDDGPPPMKNMRPALKHPNAPDKFASEHRYEHECPSQDDPYKTVKTHNEACPKLKDELDRRRSLAKVTAITQTCRRAIAGYDTNCKSCRRCLKLRNEKQKTFRRNRQRRSEKVAKNKRPKGRGAVYSMAKSVGSKSCQYIAESIHRGTSPKTSVVFIKMVDEDLAKDTEYAKKRAEVEENLNASNSNLNNEPEPSNPSITTYNSFLSMEHEPMV